MSEHIKTITYLNSKPWYRAIKILYGIFVVGCYLVAFGSIIGMLFIEDEFKLALLWLVILKILFVPWAISWAWLISKIPQWIFYYIYFGSIKPHK